jgi:hypothetical protein
VRGLFQFPVAARFIALLSLVGLCADGAMAQSAPQLLLGTLDPTDIAAEPVPAHTNLKLFERALTIWRLSRRMVISPRSARS